MSGETLRPDVILLDIEMPEGDGIGVTAALHMAQPATRVIVFTAFDRDEQILRALRAGAEGYLLKGTEREQVFRAIRAAHAGRALIEPVVAAKLIRQVRREHPDLTPRERQVLALVARGLPNKVIAMFGLCRATADVAAHTLAELVVGQRHRTRC